MSEKIKGQLSLPNINKGGKICLTANSADQNYEYILMGGCAISNGDTALDLNKRN